ncbi:MAG: translocation/assembly module TamB domain-containing protein [Casimicrobiaceae bacterium]
MADTATPGVQATAPRRRPRAWKIALAVIAIVAVVLAALVGLVLSEPGLPFIVARIVAQSGGRISVEQPSGSIAGTMRFRRITWHGTDVTVIADDVAVDWNPGALWSSRLSIRGLGARHVDIAIKPSAAATPPPTDLALPIAVSIDRLDIARIDWRAGPRAGHVSGLEFGYDGDANRHRIHDLRFIADQGAIAGNVSVAARAPLAVDGQLAMTGAAALDGARLAVTLSGTLPELDVTATGTLRGAQLTLDATATPFAQAAFARAHAELGGVDAAAFDPALPHTQAHLRLDARAQAAGIAGTFDLVNDAAGPIDSGRLPVTALTASYVFDGTTLALDDLAARLAGGGSASGSARVVTATDARAARAKLALRDVDLARIDTRLAATRLAGNVDASADAARQTLQGEVADRRMSLAFAAVITRARIDVTRFLARTGGGSLAGSASAMRNDAGDFSLQAVMHHVDPSRFFAMPSAALDGSIDARGTMHPAWRVAANATIAQGSRFDGVAVSGTGKATLEAATIREADIDLAIASARLHAKGDAGRSGDSISVTFDAPRLGELAPLLPAAVPRPVSGEAHFRAALETGAGTGRAIAADLGGALELRASGLKAGKHYAAATLALRASLSRSALPRPVAWGERRLAIDIDATGIATPLRSLDSFHASVSGTPAHHHAAIALRGTDIDANAQVDGSLSGVDRSAQAAWSGTLVSLENRGAVAFALGAPATFALARDHLRLTGVHVVAAGGRADIDELTWDSGRITTRGRFSGVTLAKAAALAGRRLPFDSTLVVGGDWSIAAAPRLEGNFALRRERGDIYAVGTGVPGASAEGAGQPAGIAAGATGAAAASERRGLGITTLEITGTLHDDALDARAAFVSTLAGTASATLHVGVAAGAPAGTIGADAPLALALRGEFASLAALQPWVGTSAAVDGKATIDVAARGTLAEPLWSGSVTGDALRIDAPQYGIDLSKGRLRAHLAPTGIALDELELAGGDGSFTATGNIALPGAASGAATSVTWKARRFRVANRPDLRLVLDGDGSLRLTNRKLALAGSVRIVEGHVEYESTPTGRLAPDIVVKGEPRSNARDAGLRDFPLSLDVDVDLGPAMTFSGEGLDARLAGKVKVSTAANGTLLGRGTIRAINGTYYAFGQRLTIDRGQVIFDGALDNPALDVVALRKNLAVEAGVQLTGTVKLPQVRVTSNPPVAENEALAWLVTGQGLNASGRADSAALSAASALLLGRSGKPLSAQIAQRFGLDEISLQSVGAAGTTGTASQVVVLGKRLSDRLTLGYEQGLSLATSALRLEYALSRSVTARAEAGGVSGVSIVYRRTFK